MVGMAYSAVCCAKWHPDMNVRKWWIFKGHIWIPSIRWWQRVGEFYDICGAAHKWFSWNFGYQCNAMSGYWQSCDVTHAISECMNMNIHPVSQVPMGTTNKVKLILFFCFCFSFILSSVMWAAPDCSDTSHVFKTYYKFIATLTSVPKESNFPEEANFLFSFVCSLAVPRPKVQIVSVMLIDSHMLRYTPSGAILLGTSASIMRYPLIDAGSTLECYRFENCKMMLLVLWRMPQTNFQHSET